MRLARGNYCKKIKLKYTYPPSHTNLATLTTVVTHVCVSPEPESSSRSMEKPNSRLLAVVEEVAP